MSHGVHRPSYFKEYYSRPDVKKRVREYNRIREKSPERKALREKRRQKALNFLRDFKSNRLCVKCGWKEHTEILNFHHKNPKEKTLSLSGGSIGQVKKERLLEEIKKCELLCPNCHFWLHYRETVNK